MGQAEEGFESLLAVNNFQESTSAYRCWHFKAAVLDSADLH
jgi:hypothetical protein